MKLRNKSDREIGVVDNQVGAVTVAAGGVGEFSDHGGADLLASFPSDWEAVDVKPSKLKKSKES